MGVAPAQVANDSGSDCSSERSDVSAKDAGGGNHRLPRTSAAPTSSTRREAGGGRDNIGDGNKGRSNSSLSSKLSSVGASRDNLEPSLPFLCPCCSSGFIVARKEFLQDDRMRKPEPHSQRSESCTCSEEENDEMERSGQRKGAGEAGIRQGHKERLIEDSEVAGLDEPRRGREGSISRNSRGMINSQSAPTAAALAGLAVGGGIGNSSFGGKLEEDDDVKSVKSGFSVNTGIVERHGGAAVASRPGDAAGLKRALKEFVQSMVKGKEFHVPGVGKELRPVTCGLTKDVDAFVVMDAGSRRKVTLKDVVQVHHGLEAMPLDLGILLDACVVVLELPGGDFVALHAGHARAAEDVVLYMRLLTAIQRQQNVQATIPSNVSGNAALNFVSSIEDDARSECSVQTGIVQQQLHSTPISSASSDPKEAKRMFKMFTETMRRGRDFYVVKPDGGLYDVECSLTKGHDEFRMRWDGQTRTVPLKELLAVHTCDEVGKLGLGIALDERCSTMELRSGECITFKFGHVEACERFLLCMRILVEQKRPRFATRGFDAGSAASSRGSGSEMLQLSSALPERMDSGVANINAAQPSSARRSNRTGGGSASTGKGAGFEADPKVAVEMFVKQMVAGCQLDVVGPAGLQRVRCSMETDLRELRLTAEDNSSRAVVLAQVRDVHVGKDATKLSLAGVSIDALCATVELNSGDCATFRFPDEVQRDRFALCVRVFANAHRQ